MVTGGIRFALRKLSRAQQALVSRIEQDTSARVVLLQGIFAPDTYGGFLEEDGEYEGIELCYVADCIPEEHLAEYPSLVQCELKMLIADNEPCNWLYSRTRDGSIDDVLHYLAEYSRLLTQGWHLESNAEFFDN